MKIVISPTHITLLSILVCVIICNFSTIATSIPHSIGTTLTNPADVDDTNGHNILIVAPNPVEQYNILNVFNLWKCQFQQPLDSTAFLVYDGGCLQHYSSLHIQELLQKNPGLANITTYNSGLVKGLKLDTYSRTYIDTCPVPNYNNIISKKSNNDDDDEQQDFALYDQIETPQIFATFSFFNSNVKLTISQIIETTLEKRIALYDHDNPAASDTRFVSGLLWADNLAIGCSRHQMFISCAIGPRANGIAPLYNYDSEFHNQMPKAKSKTKNIVNRCNTKVAELFGVYNNKNDDNNNAYPTTTDSHNNSPFRTFADVFTPPTTNVIQNDGGYLLYDFTKDSFVPANVLLHQDGEDHTFTPYHLPLEPPVTDPFFTTTENNNIANSIVTSPTEQEEEPRQTDDETTTASTHSHNDSDDGQPKHTNDKQVNQNHDNNNNNNDDKRNNNNQYEKDNNNDQQNKVDSSDDVKTTTNDSINDDHKKTNETKKQPDKKNSAMSLLSCIACSIITITSTTVVLLSF